MTVGLVTSAVGASSIPESVRALSSLPDIGYADRFTLSTEVDATPEQWARAIFGDVPSPAELLIWRGLLGLRLSQGRSPTTVAGWRIGDQGDDWIRLEAASWFLTGNLLIQVDDGRVSLATFLHYYPRLGRGLWPPLSPIHRRLVPGLLRDAAARAARGCQRPSKDGPVTPTGGGRSSENGVWPRRVSAGGDRVHLEFHQPVRIDEP
jgi:hypothetical protein